MAPMRQTNNMMNRMYGVLKAEMHPDIRTKMSQILARGRVSDKDAQKMQDRRAAIKSDLGGCRTNSWQRENPHPADPITAPMSATAYGILAQWMCVPSMGMNIFGLTGIVL
jgi:hypothetical protein